MALNFDPGAYLQATQLGNQREAANASKISDITDPLMQSLALLNQQRQQKQQMGMQQQTFDMQKQREAREQKEFDMDNMPLEELIKFNSSGSLSGPVSSMDSLKGSGFEPQSMTRGPLDVLGGGPTATGQQEVPQTQMGNMVSAFRQFQQRGKAPQQMAPQQGTPLTLETLTSPENIGRYSPRQLKMVSEAKENLTKAPASASREPGSIDAVLADKVNKGEITLEQALEMKKQSSGGGSFMLGGIGGDGKPIFYNTKDPSNVKTGEVPGGGMLYPKTPSEGQQNASLFGKRAGEANLQLDTLTQGGFDPTSLTTGGSQFLPNMMQPEKMQQFEQTKRNFINAVLRKESGAMISNEEMKTANLQYFPQIGDERGVLQQKAMNRKTAIDGLNKMAGQLASAPSQQPTASVAGGGAGQTKLKTVIQNGHSYTLNEQTGQYE